MCIILDANMFSQFTKGTTDEDMIPLRDWVYKGTGKIAYANTPKFRAEWRASRGHALRRQLDRRGKLKSVPDGDVLQKQNELKGQIKSDDPHLIALAIVANVKVSVSKDKALHQDFKNRQLEIGGKVYQDKKHARLLTKDLCL